MDNYKQKRILEAKEHAKSKGGECLSNEYSTTHSKLLWRCANNHKWEASYKSILQQKYWCRKCARVEISNKQRNQEGIKIAKEYAESKGGKCLSNNYEKAKAKLVWKCEKSNHNSWEASYDTVVNHGKWCPQCAIEIRADKKTNKNGLLNAQKYAESKGGKCLSTEYRKAIDKLEWKCDKPDHKSWFASYSGVMSGSWCPECSFFYYKEHKVRDVLEYLLDGKFPKSKPIWNINPKTNKLLELDGYSEEKRLAFEFQGLHHYEDKIFHKSKVDLEYIKYKDEVKKNNCIENNVKLIIIDDKFKLSEQDKILKDITDLLMKEKIDFRKEIDPKEINEIFKKHINHQVIYLSKAKEYAESRGGECLSTNYTDAKTKLKWKCGNEEHSEWYAGYHTVIKGHWCPQCAGEKTGFINRNKNGLEIAYMHAESKGGQCLSTNYKNAHSKLIWKCSNKGHKTWSATYSHVLKGAWCPQCHFEKNAINKLNKNGLLDAKKYAETKGGECLSTEYINSSEKLEWKCSNKNHDSWHSSYGTVVLSKHWCPQCGKEKIAEDRKNKNGLKNAQQHAADKGGKCLSTEYIRADDKLEWKCANNNHLSWFASYSKVVKGMRWCPQCARENRKKND